MPHILHQETFQIWEADMFVYSMRASTVKLVGVICVALTVLITLIAFVPTYSLPTEPMADADAEIGRAHV